MRSRRRTTIAERRSLSDPLHARFAEQTGRPHQQEARAPARRGTSSRCRRRRAGRRRPRPASRWRRRSDRRRSRPTIEVKPPMISTGSALSTISDSENCTPTRAPQSKPGDQRDAAGHRPDDRPDAAADRCPTAIAASGSSATARSASPSAGALEEERRARSPAAPAVAAANRSNWLIITPWTWKRRSVIPELQPCTSEPHTVCASPSRTKLRPSVAMNRTIGGRLTSGRSTTRSTATPSSTMTASDAASAATKRQAALDQAHEGQRREAAPSRPARS